LERALLTNLERFLKNYKTTYNITRSLHTSQQNERKEGKDKKAMASDPIAATMTTIAAAAAAAATSNLVYIRSREHAWIPARVVVPAQLPGGTTNSSRKGEPNKDAAVAVVQVQAPYDAKDAAAAAGGGGREAHKSSGGGGKQQALLRGGAAAAVAQQNRQQQQHVTVHLADYPNQALPLQNVNEQGRLVPVEDMGDLPFLHEVRLDSFLFLLRCFCAGVRALYLCAIRPGKQCNIISLMR
jgi:hypothetical protein